MKRIGFARSCALALALIGCGNEAPTASEMRSSGTGGAASAAGSGGSAHQESTAGGGGSPSGNIDGGPRAGHAGDGAGQGGGIDGSHEAGVPPQNCTAVADQCPMPTGIQFACKRRFALGLNYAWRNFGADFGGLAAMSIGSVSQAPADYEADLKAMKDNGASVIRWWMFPDFRGDGVQFDANGTPSGISSTARADIDKALALAEQTGVYLVPTILSFDGFRPTATKDGITIRGITELVHDADKRAKLVANVVQPIAEAAATSAHVGHLIGWDIINEPEWAVAKTGQNAQDFDPNAELLAVSLADMKALINEAAAVLKQKTPQAFTSVGFAAAKWSWAFKDVHLDVNQPHIYAWVNQYWPYTQKPDALGYPSAPTVMGEFFLAAMPFADSAKDAFATVLDSWWNNGYAGAWAWQHFDAAQSMPLLKAFADSKGCPAGF